MKIKKIFLLLILFILVLFIATNVLAEDSIPKADFSEANFNVRYTNNSVQFYSLEVSNITLPTKSNGTPVEMNVRYTIGNIQPEFSSTYGESYPGTYDAETKKLVFNRAETALQLKGDVYFWIFQLDDTALGTTKTGSLVYSAKMERPDDKKYSELFGSPLIGSTLTYISINTPMENYLTRKAQFRIGEIKDNSILSEIKNNDMINGYDKLLKYGKTSSTIYDGVLEGNPNFAANLYNDLLGNVKNDTYYFIYTKFDDEEGKYYPVEGVTVGLGLAPTTKSCEIAFFGNPKFNWNNFKDTDSNKDTTDDNEESKEDTTVATTPIPKAGKNMIILEIAITLGILAIVWYFLYKKYSL